LLGEGPEPPSRWVRCGTFMTSSGLPCEGRDTEPRGEFHSSILRASSKRAQEAASTVSWMAFCTTLHGQYGHDGDVSMGVPCVIGATGVERILEVPLDDWEQEHLAPCKVVQTG
jgi:hypothetical protein